MLLAEMYLEANETAKIGPLLEPLLTGIHGSTGAALDPSTLRALALAMRAYLAQQQNDKAADAARLLLDVGPDDRQVNGALVDYARYLRKQAAAQPATNAAFTALAGKLAGRKEFSLGERIFLGSVYRDLGRRVEAARFFRAALEQADQEPTKLSKQMLEVLTQVRLLMVDMLREQEDYRAASEEVDRLIQDNPRLLEPMIKKAQVLQGWSTLDPDKLDAATGQWIRVRSALQSAHAPQDVYYNAVYNTAECLYLLGRQTKDHAKIIDAEKILKATLITNQNLNGPETVKRFHALLDKIKAALPPGK
jgi:tetratricopeptide (TPR) repeat protein